MLDAECKNIWIFISSMEMEDVVVKEKLNEL